MDTVWQLENEQQIAASEDLSCIVQDAKAGFIQQRDYLKSLWLECSWKTIKERLNTEGSVWYVWWMDGVNQHIINIDNS